MPLRVVERDRKQSISSLGRDWPDLHAMTVIRDCTYLVRVDEGYRLAHGDIVVREKIIAEITKPNAAPVAGQPVMLGTGCLVVPGFVNAHTHSPLNVLRGTVDGMDHVGFMWTNQADTAGRSEDEVYASALLGCLDMIRSGITAAIDHFPEQNCTVGAVDPVARAYADSGMRAVVALRVFDQGYDDIDPANIEGLEPSIVAEIAGDNPLIPVPADELTDMCEDTIARWHGGRIQIFPGPSNPLRCSDDLLMACHQIAQRHDLGIHTHLLETEIQKSIAGERHGHSTIEHLRSLGVLDHRWSFAHTIWVDDRDIELLADSGAVVVHNPHSNAKIGAGVAPVGRMLERGVIVAIGTDGASTNDTLGLHEAMSLALLLPRITGASLVNWPTAEFALDMATTGGAAALHAANSLGTIAAGMRADLVFYDLRTPTLAPLNDPVQQLIFAERGRSVRTVMIDGTVVFDDGAFSNVDVESVIDEVIGMRKMQGTRNRGLYDLARQLSR